MSDLEERELDVPRPDPTNPLERSDSLGQYLRDGASRTMTRDNVVLVGVVAAWVVALFTRPDAAEALEPFALAAFGAVLGQAMPRSTP